MARFCPPCRADRSSGGAGLVRAPAACGLGDEFLASVANAFLRMEEAPEQFPIYHQDFRRVLTDRFPYKIFFRIEADNVVVFRILHAARDHTWRLR